MQINPVLCGRPLYEGLGKVVEERFEGVIPLRRDGCSKHYVQTTVIPNEHDLLYNVVRSREISPEHLASAVREAVARGLVRRKRLHEELASLEDDTYRRIAEEAMTQ